MPKTSDYKIIHVAGAPGSGKTTLGKRLKKLRDVVVIETDEIYDRAGLEMLKSSDWDGDFSQEKYNRFMKRFRKKVACYALHIINSEENKDKHLIIIGITFFEKAFPPKYADRGYIIDIDIETNFNQFVSRTVNTISREKTKILRDAENTDDFRLYMRSVFKHGVRTHNFPVLRSLIKQFHDVIDEDYGKTPEGLRYMHMTSDEIYEDIKKYLAQQ